jgi:hypothetical protein
VIQAWNTAAGYFFGIPAWKTSAHRCADVVRCLGCAGNCPLEGAVAAADVRHLPVHDGEGRLLGILHLLSPVERVTS